VYTTVVTVVVLGANEEVFISEDVEDDPVVFETRETVDEEASLVFEPDEVLDKASIVLEFEEVVATVGVAEMSPIVLDSVEIVDVAEVSDELLIVLDSEEETTEVSEALESDDVVEASTVLSAEVVVVAGDEVLRVAESPKVVLPIVRLLVVEGSFNGVVSEIELLVTDKSPEVVEAVSLLIED